MKDEKEEKEICMNGEIKRQDVDLLQLVTFKIGEEEFGVDILRCRRLFVQWRLPEYQILLILLKV